MNRPIPEKIPFVSLKSIKDKNIIVKIFLGDFLIKSPKIAKFNITIKGDMNNPAVPITANASPIKIVL